MASGKKLVGELQSRAGGADVVIAVPGPADLSRQQAQELTRELRVAVDSVGSAVHYAYELLRRAHDLRAHQALGYASWEEYVEAEVGMTKQRASQVLQEGDTRSALRAELPEIGETNAFDALSGRAVRAIRPHLQAVAAGVRQRLTEGAPADRALAEAVRSLPRAPGKPAKQASRQASAASQAGQPHAFPRRWPHGRGHHPLVCSARAPVGLVDPS
jgi:hypothetical protein